MTALDYEMLDEISEIFVRDLHNSEYFRDLPNPERIELGTRLAQDAANGYRPLLPGAPVDRIEALARALQQRSGLVLPAGWKAVLSEVDGFVQNGVILYCVDAEFRPDGFRAGPELLMENVSLHENYPEIATQHLILGESESCFYVEEVRDGRYARINRYTRARTDFGDDAFAMLNAMLREALNYLDEPEREDSSA